MYSTFLWLSEDLSCDESRFWGLLTSAGSAECVFVLGKEDKCQCETRITGKTFRFMPIFKQ